MRRAFLGALVLLACGCGDRQTATGPSSNRVSITGRVLDFRSQAPVSGAAVRLTSVESTFDAAFRSVEAITDAGGAYAMSVPVTGGYTLTVDGAGVGLGLVHGSTYRGDLLIRGGTCISRYGSVTEEGTLRPVAGATVSAGGGSATTGPDGWYRFDLGCVFFPGGTTFGSVRHPNYVTQQIVEGRGVCCVWRRDIALARK